MAAGNAKDILRELKKSSPTIRTDDGKYKQAYSDAIWSLVDRVITENDELRQHLGAMEDIAKATVNSAQLQVQQVRNLEKLMSRMSTQLNTQLKALPRPDDAGNDTADDVDLKGE